MDTDLSFCLVLSPDLPAGSGGGAVLLALQWTLIIKCHHQLSHYGKLANKLYFQSLSSLDFSQLHPPLC